MAPKDILATEGDGVEHLALEEGLLARKRAGQEVVATGVVEPEPITKRSPAERALRLAMMFMTEIRERSTRLGRPVVPDDFSDQELAVFGLDRFTAKAFLDPSLPQEEFFVRVAGIWLDAVERGATKDHRYAPSLIVP